MKGRLCAPGVRGGVRRRKQPVSGIAGRLSAQLISPVLRGGRHPGLDPNLWVPLLAANLPVEPIALAAALCGTASGGCGSTPAHGSVFRWGGHPLRVLSSFAFSHFTLMFVPRRSTVCSKSSGALLVPKRARGRAAPLSPLLSSPPVGCEVQQFTNLVTCQQQVISRNRHR